MYDNPEAVSWIAANNRIASGEFSPQGFIWPDFTFIFSMDYDTLVERVLGRGGELDFIESRGPEYFAKVNQGFVETAENNPDNYAVIDAKQSKKDIFNKHIKPKLDELVASRQII